MVKMKEYVVYSGCGLMTECFSSNEKELSEIVADAIKQYYVSKKKNRWHVQMRVRKKIVEQKIIYDKSYRDYEFPIE